MATNPFVPYSIPILGLKNGTHHFEYQLDSDFFSHFEDSLIKNGEIHFDVELDKRPDMLLFEFVLKGYVDAVCDRCTADIHLPIEGEQQLIVKFGDEDMEDDEFVFIPHESSVFNLAKYLYEYSTMALPLITTYDCQNDEKPPCNFDVLKHIKNEDDMPEEPNSIWDSLKDLKNDN